LYLRSNISGLHLFRTDSLLSVLDRSLMIAICSVLLFTNIINHQFRIEWFVYAQTTAYVITALITFAIVLSKTGRLKWRFKRSFFLAFLKQSYPYALLILLMSFYNRIDSVMLERLLPNGKEQAGIYAHAFRLLDAFSMMGLLFSGLLLPIFARMIKQKDDIASMVRFSYLLIIVPAIIIAFASCCYNLQIMQLLNYSHPELSASIFSILMLGFTGIATTYIFGTLLTANGSIKQLNQMALSGMALNITMNLILIPRIQALGSAYASLTTQLFTAIAQAVIAKQIFRLNFNFRLIGKIILFAVFTVVAGLLSKQISSWQWGFIAMISASVLFAFAIRLFNLKALVLIIRNEPSNNEQQVNS
jgi:O-antigen/teichoic acid export membrane protein